jgi:hypothetical protein
MVLDLEKSEDADVERRANPESWQTSRLLYNINYHGSHPMPPKY